MIRESRSAVPAGEHDSKHVRPTQPWHLWVGASLPWLALVFLRHSGYGQQAAWVLGLGITAGLAGRLALQGSVPVTRRLVVYALPLAVALAGALAYNFAPGSRGASLAGGFASGPLPVPSSRANLPLTTASTAAPPVSDTSTLTGPCPPSKRWPARTPRSEATYRATLQTSRSPRRSPDCKLRRAAPRMSGICTA